MGRFFTVRSLLIGVLLSILAVVFIQPWNSSDVPCRLIEIASSIALLLVVRFGYHRRGWVPGIIDRIRLNRQIDKQFEANLSGNMVRLLQKDPEMLRLDGNTMKACAMVCHVRDLNGMIKRGKSDPRRLLSMINRTIEIVRNIVVANYGLMGRYSYDRMIACWGALISTDGSVSRAVAAAIELSNRIEKMDPLAPKDLAISIGIGISSGEMLVGNVGMAKDVEYGCMGSATGTANMLSEKSTEYHVAILVSSEIAGRIDDHVIKVELDTVKLNGHPVGMPIYAIIGYSKSIGTQLQISTCYSQHAKFLSAYRDQRWDMAMVIGNSLRTAWKGHLKAYYEMMVSRCKAFKENPPGKNWDGIYREN
jgi:adenylate cyclase